MGMIVGRGLGLGLALALLGGVGAVAPLQAQVVIGSQQEECRCVDADGNRIEDCTCIRSADFPIRSFTLSGMGLDRRAQIGVGIDMEQDDDEVRGVRLTEVIEDSPAEEAGLRAGDVVISVAGSSVFDLLDDEVEEGFDEDRSIVTQRFVKIVGDLEPEEEVAVVVLRNGQRTTLEVTPEAASGVFTLRGFGGERFFGQGGDFELDEEQRRAMEEGFERAREELRAFNFRFDEEDRQRLQEQAERVQEQALRMRELTERRGGEMRELEELAETLRESRIGRLRDLEEQEARGLFFRAEAEMDPCTELVTERGSRIMIIGGDGCIDGLRLADMNEGLAVYFGTDTGVLVTEVAESSSLGLEAGDVVLRVGDRTVEDSADLRRILQSYETDETVNFRVRRENREIQVSGTRRGN